MSPILPRCTANYPLKSFTKRSSIPIEQAAAHFGWLAPFVGHDMSASSELTQQQLDWQPSGPGLLSDLEQMEY